VYVRAVDGGDGGSLIACALIRSWRRCICTSRSRPASAPTSVGLQALLRTGQCTLYCGYLGVICNALLSPPTPQTRQTRRHDDIIVHLSAVTAHLRPTLGGPPSAAPPKTRFHLPSSPTGCGFGLSQLSVSW